jgi:tetratricopeptide (TPR) repeat protein
VRVFGAICLALAVATSAGLVDFQSSSAGAAQAAFLRGLTALHYFEYEDANDAFREAARLDPSFAMAYWGEARTYYQTLWRNENVAEARRALARLGPTAPARSAKARTPTEQALLGAVEILFGDGDAAARRERYAEAMGRLHAREPGDPEVASLYALALLGTMSRSLIGASDAHEGHSQALAGSETQARVAAILDGVLKSHPDPPGALHYLLHNYDDPAHAALAAGAARAAGDAGAASSHALHMPAHIFFQLGLWHDAARSDRAAFAESDAWVRRRKLDPALRSYHALSWWQYELLQLGRYREARAALDELAPVVKASGQLGLLSDLSSMRARMVIESADWALMATANTFGNVNELFALGMSAGTPATPSAPSAPGAGWLSARRIRAGGLAPGDRDHGARAGGDNRARGRPYRRRGADAPGRRRARGESTGAAWAPGADQAGAGTARRDARHRRPPRGGHPVFRSGAAPQPQSIALGPRPRPRLGGRRRRRGRAPALHGAARQLRRRRRRSAAAARSAGRDRTDAAAPVLLPLG